MIKFIMIAVILCWAPLAPAKETNYQKIVAEWSSHVAKQRHHITNENSEKHSKKNHFKILEQWKSGVVKTNEKAHNCKKEG